ncbi:type II CAAX endopeptidase family protein [Barnesiella sp. An55]|uniref:CPBP family intramembrane glutamic endopeptidase n=1 Tax=Barnesiella sp. An55 TaxID=1965646 RepID=UPI000B3844C9|nr:type II CAAX endopeptidase family protein [Barnesiella sp. An55]OUN74759.1 hypothetical protein B5G10_00610 [Barnesiella sp. An55]
MKLTEYIRQSSVGVKLIVLLILILCGVFVIAIPMLFVQGEYALLIGMYLQNIGMFILPAWFAAMLFWGDASRGLHLNKVPRLVELLCIVLLYFVATPMFNRLVEWNESISLPAAFSGIEAWMRQQEEAAAVVTEQLMQIKSLPHFLAIIVGIGVLTGMGEEMVFRGILQQVVQGKSRRAHWAVWISAFLFSAIHLQFYGFFPRLLLGAFFGYLLVWSRNLWLPIFGHMFNNSMVACISYFTGNASDNAMEALGTAQSSTGWLAWVSLVATALLLYLFYKKVFLASRGIKETSSGGR